MRVEKIVAASSADMRRRNYFSALTSLSGRLQEFLCAINGHVMKEPVKARTTGLVFECATIELWLSTRGAVCPITNTQLLRTDLTPDDDLRNR
jgi:hypothetical protein